MSRRSKSNRVNRAACTKSLTDRVLGGGIDAPSYNGLEVRQSMRVQKYLKLIEMLAVSRFEWHGLPDGIDERYLELTLFESGVVLFHPNGEWKRFVVSGGAVGGLNNYNNPTRFDPMAPNYAPGTMDSKHCVPIWDNPLRCTMRDVVVDYAMRLASCDKAIDVNLDNVSVPLIIRSKETQKLTVENIMRAREQGAPYVYTYDTMDADGLFATFPNQTPNLSKDLLEVKNQIWNEMITYLGIQNSSTEKRERLVADEAEYAQERTNVYRQSYLKCRQQACDQINRLWLERVGMHLSVSWRDTGQGAMLGTDVTSPTMEVNYEH